MLHAVPNYLCRMIAFCVGGGTCDCASTRVRSSPERTPYGHLGISRMKALARMFVWWPGLDKDIEKMVQSLSRVSTVSPVSPSCSSTSMEVALLSIVTYSFGLRWPIPGSHVFCGH